MLKGPLNLEQFNLMFYSVKVSCSIIGHPLYLTKSYLPDSEKQEDHAFYYFKVIQMYNTLEKIQFFLNSS